ncbi:hypothetical protein ACO0QE_001982 [Hanseniaspora vineae]
MSLVSALDRTTRTSEGSGTTTTTTTTTTTVDTTTTDTTKSYKTPNVYQVDGKPLSKEALYKAKLKYGFYQSPAIQQSTGFADTQKSSNKAASLAAQHYYSSVLTHVQDEEHHLTKEEQYKRLLTSTTPSLKSTTSTDANRTLFDTQTLQKVAKQAIQKKTPKTKSQKKTHTVVQAELPTKISTGNINLSKVLTGAERNAHKRIAKASGIDDQGVAVGNKNLKFNYYIKRENQQTMEFKHQVLGKGVPEWYAQANKAAASAVDQFHDQLDYKLDSKGEKYAHVAAEKSGPILRKEREEEEAKRDLYLNAHAHSHVLALARESVLKQMNAMEFEAVSKRDPSLVLFSNEEFNKAAVEYVTKKYDANEQARLLKKNKVDLGGGLLLSQKELDEIAYKIVSPLLREIDSKTVEQRRKDQEIASKTRYNKEETKLYKLNKKDQQERERARTAFEKQHVKEEETLNKELVKIEKTGELINIPDLLQQIKSHNDEINKILEDDEDLTTKIESFEKDIAAHKATIDEITKDIKTKKAAKDKVLTTTPSNEGVTGEPLNKYDYQVYDNEVVMKQVEQAREQAFVIIQQKNLENHKHDLELNEKVKQTLQQEIDVKLEKLKNLEDLGTKSKEKYNLLDKLKEENHVNIVSRGLYIRSTFGKDLDTLIAQEKQKEQEAREANLREANLSGPAETNAVTEAGKREVAEVEKKGVAEVSAPATASELVQDDVLTEEVPVEDPEAEGAEHDSAYRLAKVESELGAELEPATDETVPRSLVDEPLDNEVAEVSEEAPAPVKKTVVETTEHEVVPAVPATTEVSDEDAPEEEESSINNDHQEKRQSLFKEVF